MKYSTAILLLLLSVGSYLPAEGQVSLSDAEISPGNAVERIMETSGGNVEIIAEDDLLQKILTPPEAKKRNSGRQSLKAGINKLSGYRIQVFADGRNQHSLESRAKARGNAIIARFPKYRGQVYTFSSSPNWYTRVGNYRSSVEASEALEELKRAFPGFSNEMRVVKSQIVIIK